MEFYLCSATVGFIAASLLMQKIPTIKVDQIGKDLRDYRDEMHRLFLSLT